MIVFLSNYYNHHQSSLSNMLYELTDKDYIFIETQYIDEERLKLGWREKKDNFVCYYYDNTQYYQQVIDKADVVIFGSAPFKLIKSRLKAHKLTFIYSERIFKSYSLKKLAVATLLAYRYSSKKNLYLLCSSAFTASDFKMLGLFKNKAYKWGYFPPLKKYKNIDDILTKKQKSSILWVGRFLDWKHPEIPIIVAKRLKEDNINFRLNMIGTGILYDDIRSLINEYDLGDYVKLLGPQSPEVVRKYMEKSKIFLFTSDRNEGWGAVLNESMNSGCSVIANNHIGAVPYLVKDGNNAFIYKDIDEAYSLVKRLLTEESLSRFIGRNAYYSIVNIWNAEEAAKRILHLIRAIDKGEETPFESGPCSMDTSFV